MISKWQRGVLEYVEELKNDLIDEGRDITLDNLLNGAKDWEQFSYGGSSCIYDWQIAERLATPSEIKSCTRKDGTLRNPNKSETWLDVQARALYQASDKILRGIV